MGAACPVPLALPLKWRGAERRGGAGGEIRRLPALLCLCGFKHSWGIPGIVSTACTRLHSVSLRCPACARRRHLRRQRAGGGACMHVGLGAAEHCSKLQASLPPQPTRLQVCMSCHSKNNSPPAATWRTPRSPWPEVSPHHRLRPFLASLAALFAYRDHSSRKPPCRQLHHAVLRRLLALLHAPQRRRGPATHWSREVLQPRGAGDGHRRLLRPAGGLGGARQARAAQPCQARHTQPHAGWRCVPARGWPGGAVCGLLCAEEVRTGGLAGGVAVVMPPLTSPPPPVLPAARAAPAAPRPPRTPWATTCTPRPGCRPTRQATARWCRASRQASAGGRRLGGIPARVLPPSLEANCVPSPRSRATPRTWW